MIDHLTLKVRDAKKSRAFYEQALAPLGYSVQMEHEGACAFGPPGQPIFWIVADPSSPPTPPMHLAFHASARRAVDAFYEAAVAAGAKDNGAPGLRPHYHPDYYAAFVRDADGNTIEAVCHAPA
jgi:catechol 2,3-dioxygenase-like lactoylglutathione lyase family enzyme